MYSVYMCMCLAQVLPMFFIISKLGYRGTGDLILNGLIDVERSARIVADVAEAKSRGDQDAVLAGYSKLC